MKDRNFRGETFADARRQLVDALRASKSWTGLYAEAYVDEFFDMVGQSAAAPPPRLVPDADPMKSLREAVAKLHGNSLVAHDKIGGPYSEGVCKGVHEALRLIDRAIAAAPPAEAPADAALRNRLEWLVTTWAAEGCDMAPFECAEQLQAALNQRGAEAPAERGDDVDRVAKVMASSRLNWSDLMESEKAQFRELAHKVIATLAAAPAAPALVSVSMDDAPPCPVWLAGKDVSHGWAAGWSAGGTHHGSKAPRVTGGREDWLRECRRALEDVATEMRATGREDSRFVRLLESMPCTP